MTLEKRIKYPQPHNIRITHINHNPVLQDYMIKKEHITEEMVTNYADMADWKFVSKVAVEKGFSNEFFYRFISELDWRRISQQKLSENFIREFRDHVHWQMLSDSPLSEDFINRA